MPGFRYCPWCHGKGCIACDAERKKHEAAEEERAARWAALPPRERLAGLRQQRALSGIAPDRESREWLERKLDAEIASTRSELDAEYDRQFPDGPEPIFVARRDRPGDMDLLGKVFNREAIEHAFGPGGEGMPEIERNAAEARAVQAARKPAKPDP